MTNHVIQQPSLRLLQTIFMKLVRKQQLKYQDSSIEP